MRLNDMARILQNMKRQPRRTAGLPFSNHSYKTY